MYNTVVSRNASSRVQGKQYCEETGKRGFTSRKLALSHAGEFKKLFKSVYRPYKCPTCKCWHLTTQTEI